MEKIPMEWVDKLFNCMQQFYGERWSSQFSMLRSEDYAKAMWQSGLVGLSYDEIKSCLIYYQWLAKNHPGSKPPHQMEFYDVAKNPSKKYYVMPMTKYEKGCPEIAKAALAQIKENLGISKSSM